MPLSLHIVQANVRPLGRHFLKILLIFLDPNLPVPFNLKNTLLAQELNTTLASHFELLHQ